jgi:hypothetical protein
MGFKVFISYSTRDLTRATQVKQLLQGAGAQAFLAEYDISAGEELTKKIVTAIKACDLFVLLWSHHARNSEWVPQEIGVAKGHNKIIMPIVLHEGVEVPGFLRGIKYLPLYSDPRKVLTWLKRHVSTKVTERSQAEGLTVLGITGVMLWLFSPDKRRR